jgi:hypothetical protein
MFAQNLASLSAVIIALLTKSHGAAIIPSLIRAFKIRGHGRGSCYLLLPDNCPRLANSRTYWQLHEVSFLGYTGKGLG